MTYKAKNILSSIQKISNGYLDKIADPKIVFLGKTWNSYQFWVYSGVITGTLVVLIIAFVKHISLPIISGVMVIVAILSFFLFKITKIFGENYPILNWAKKGVYHFQIVALGFTLGFLTIVNAPILVNLDILVIGMLLYQAFGRIGCLTTGCCHGRPSRWGICYGDKYSETGYIYFINKIRFFPVQFIECIWLFFLAIVSVLTVLNFHLPGDNVSRYVIGYGILRFFLEFMRGDPKRVYFSGFSEAQWTALSLSIIVICLEIRGILPLQFWHSIPVIIMSLTLIALLLRKHYHRPTIHQLRHPDHILEIFQTIGWLNSQHINLSTEGAFLPKTLVTGTTSLGIQITLCGFPDKSNMSLLYRLSLVAGRLRIKSAKTISKLIILLKYNTAQYKIIENDNGNFDLLINFLPYFKEL
jgi:prolipoprotein diacylglyceryltransferase